MLKWFRRGTQTPKKPLRAGGIGLQVIPLRGGTTVEVVGESFHQDALEEITGGKTENSIYLPVTAMLVPEPNNPHDRNAIAVEIEGKPVGHLSREGASAYSKLAKQLLRRSAVGSCAAEIRGGWRRPGGDEGYYGVVLDLAPPTFFRDQDFEEE
jgi:hypothetical protein